MEITEKLKKVWIDTAKALKGAARRVFMARTVEALGRGGQCLAETELGWNRCTIRKGQHEVRSGITCLDAFGLRGRKRAEQHLPRLLEDIKEVVDGQSQTDPSFRSQRLYTRLSAAETRRQLIAKKSYQDAELPTERTIAKKLDQLGYRPAKVQKTRPKKKSARPMQSLSD